MYLYMQFRSENKREEQIVCGVVNVYLKYSISCSLFLGFKWTRFFSLFHSLLFKFPSNVRLLSLPFKVFYQILKIIYQNSIKCIRFVFLFNFHDGRLVWKCFFCASHNTHIPSKLQWCVNKLKSKSVQKNKARK